MKVNQDDMDAIARKLFCPIILALDAWTFQYLVLVYYAHRREVRVRLLLVAAFLSFTTHLYFYDDQSVSIGLNTVSETCLQQTFIIQITIIGRDVCVKVKLRSIRYLTYAAEIFIALGWLQVIASVLGVTGIHDDGAVHLLGNVLETVSLVFVLMFRFYYLALSRCYRRLIVERKFELLLYVVLALHEFPFVLLEHHTDVTWEFVQGVCNRLIIAACILQNLRKKATPSNGSSRAATSKRGFSETPNASMRSSRGSFLHSIANGPTPRKSSLPKLVPRRSGNNVQAFPDIAKIAAISEKHSDSELPHA